MCSAKDSMGFVEFPSFFWSKVPTYRGLFRGSIFRVIFSFNALELFPIQRDSRPFKTKPVRFFSAKLRGDSDIFQHRWIHPKRTKPWNILWDQSRKKWTSISPEPQNMSHFQLRSCGKECCGELQWKTIQAPANPLMNQEFAIEHGPFINGVTR